MISHSLLYVWVWQLCWPNTNQNNQLSSRWIASVSRQYHDLLRRQKKTDFPQHSDTTASERRLIPVRFISLHLSRRLIKYFPFTLAARLLLMQYTRYVHVRSGIESSMKHWNTRFFLFVTWLAKENVQPLVEASACHALPLRITAPQWFCFYATLHCLKLIWD